MKALSIGYHDVIEPSTVSGTPPEVLFYSLDRPKFCEHLSLVRRHAQSAIKTINGFHPWTDGMPVFLTFDDGFAGMYTCVVDELERRGWRGHFFITTDWIGRPGFLTAAQIREIHDRGHVIGSHSCSHPERMSCLPRNDLEREWGGSCSRLADILGTRVTVASVPGGYHSPKVVEVASHCGIEALFTSEPTSHVKTLNQCMILGRYSVRRGSSPALTAALASGHYWPRLQQTLTWQIKEAVKAITGEHYYSLWRSLLPRSESTPAPRV